MANLKTPWLAAPALEPVAFERLRQRAVFECHKWDPQVEDGCALAPFPLMLRAAEWIRIVDWAERLSREALAAEYELLRRPELHARLGLPASIRRALRRVPRHGGCPGAARLIRFDFHLTTDGWRISEANCDVPGGLIEGSRLTRLVSEHYPGAVTCGDPAGCLADAIRDRIGRAATVALVHATAYTDDRQVMTYLAGELESRGLNSVLASPAHLLWRDGWAFMNADWDHGALAFVVRFFPAEWLPNLPSRCDWARFFAGSRTLMSNPGSALLTQSKRFPLVWDALSTPLDTWRTLLPRTCDPAAVDEEAIWDAWVLKPAFGRVGENVLMEGVSDVRQYEKLVREVRRHPRAWVAQQRFRAVHFLSAGRMYYPCIGVFTVDGKVAGAYGRVARRPLIDGKAQDAAVLIAGPETERTAHGFVVNHGR